MWKKILEALEAIQMKVSEGEAVEKITLRAETQMRMMKHKGDESVKLLPKKKKKERKKERKI